MNARPIATLGHPIDADITVPGSKSITNRALVAATLADGESRLTGWLDSDDTRAMIGVSRTLGAHVDLDDDLALVTGTGGRLSSGDLDLDVRQSGTTARFATPLAARGPGSYRIDGSPEMRARPMTETIDALRSLGVRVESAPGGSLPITVGPGFGGGRIALAASVSSQFASGLMLAAPGSARGLDLTIEGAIVSQPYLDLTVAVMLAFGAEVERPASNRYVVAPTPYRAVDYRIEPDASAASYFFAAAAVTGGRVRIEGLGSSSLQGDVGFVDVLASMGAEVVKGESAIEVRGTGTLRGIDVDMADISDTAQTLAAIAPLADGPTRVTGIGFIRRKETDRVAAVVTELRRMGIDAVENDDGFTIVPGRPQPAVIETYRDHRMAMSFAITGLVAPGIEIADPGCVQKTFPGFWDTLDSLS